MSFPENTVELWKSIVRELDSITIDLLISDPLANIRSDKQSKKLNQHIKELDSLLDLANRMIVTTSNSNPGYELRDIPSEYRDRLVSIEFRLKQLGTLYMIEREA